MKKNILIYIGLIVGLLTCSSLALAKDLRMAKAAHQNVATARMDSGGDFLHSSVANKTPSGRLWLARRNFAEKRIASGAGIDMAGRQTIAAPESAPNNTENNRVCKLAAPGKRLFWKGNLDLPRERENCS